MTHTPWQQLLDSATAVPGVRGAVLVSVDDGLVIAESAMDHLATADVAALASAIVQRACRVSAAAGHRTPHSVRVSGEAGTLMAFAADGLLWLVAVADPSAELGRLRLLLGDLAASLRG
ncbi:MAG: roadblock/LC7 domain-containing protein [Gemmatimonadales bacterium]